MKKRHYSLLFLLGCALTANAQPPAAKSKDTILSELIFDEATAGDSVDLSVFGLYARDSSRYAQLVERFNRADSTLTDGEICILYYGAAYRDGYDATWNQQQSDSWRTLMRNGQNGKAYKTMLQALKIEPAAPNLLFYALESGAFRRQKILLPLKKRLDRISEAVSFLGDGTVDKPLPVVNMTDEAALVWIYFDLNIVPWRKVSADQRRRVITNTNDAWWTLKMDEGFKIKHTLYNVEGVLCDAVNFTPPLHKFLFSGAEMWFDVSLPIGAAGVPIRNVPEFEILSHEIN